MVIKTVYFNDSICIFLFDLYCKCLSARALYFSPIDDTNVFCTSNSTLKCVHNINIVRFTKIINKLSHKLLLFNKIKVKTTKN